MKTTYGKEEKKKLESSSGIQPNPQPNSGHEKGDFYEIKEIKIEELAIDGICGVY